MADRKEFDFVRVGNTDVYVPQYDDTGIKKSIADETTARTNADNTLQSAINKEKEDRQYTDSSLQTAINKEVTYRKTADANLQKNIDDNGNKLSALRQEFNSTRNSKNIVLIGDSYLEGYTPDGNVISWGEKLKNLMPFYNFTIKYQGGAGFSHPSGRTGERFIDLLNKAGNDLSEAERNNVSLVLIGGGYNDKDESKADLQNYINTFANRSRELFPYAEIDYSLIGWSWASASRNKLRTMCSNLKYCRTSGVKILTSTIFTLHDYSFLSSDGVHPNDDGQNAIAQTMAQVINGGDVNIELEYKLFEFSSSQMNNVAEGNSVGTKNYMTLRSTFANGNNYMLLEGRLHQTFNNNNNRIATYPKDLRIGEGWDSPKLTDFSCFIFGLDDTNTYFSHPAYVRFASNGNIGIYHKIVDSNDSSKFKTIACTKPTSYCNFIMPMTICSAFDL